MSGRTFVHGGKSFFSCHLEPVRDGRIGEIDAPMHGRATGKGTSSRTANRSESPNHAKEPSPGQRHREAPIKTLDESNTSEASLKARKINRFFILKRHKKKKTNYTITVHRELRMT